MFEFKKLCNEYENLTFVERGAVLVNKSVEVISKLKEIAKDTEIDPLTGYAYFILASIVSDGKVSEQEYLLMYPALLKVFGESFNFKEIKYIIEEDKDGKKTVKNYIKEFLGLVSHLSDDLKKDLITLSLCVVSMDGKVSFKERNYIRKLLK